MSDSEGSSSHHIHASKATQSNTSFPASIRAVKDSSAISENQRTLVVCLDGTGDRFDADNSNVVHFVSCLKKHAPDQQVTYYQSGIGTYDEGGLQNGIGAALDMAVGSGLGNHIKDAYRFLMQHYREGDKVCLLGFSRGAYTVRCLAGMLHKVGLLPPGNIAQINFAYAFYKDDSPNGWKMSAQFKYTFCTDLDVYFVGVWDCVSSVGFIPRTLPFSHSPTNSIHYFRHAIALDEHRAKFDVSHWGSQDPDVKKSDTTNGTSRPGLLQGIERLENSEDDAQARFEAHFEALEASKGPAVETDVLEVWFMGAHADVGGGSVKNDVRHQLSRIPLRWMFRQCFECNTGILFDTASLVDFGLDLHTLYPVYHPPTQPECGPPPALLDKYKKNQVPPLRWRRALFSIGGEAADQEVAKDDPESHHLHLMCEATEDHFDARAPVNDQLAKSRTWWILEFWPVNLWVLATSGVDWVKRIGINLGRHRAVRVKEPRMHWTVQHMVDEGKYQVRARTHREAAWKVVT